MRNIWPLFWYCQIDFYIDIYFELKTKGKIIHFMKIIQNDQQSLNINSLNYGFKAHFD